MQLTQLQVWIAIAAIASPSVLALIGILVNNHGINRLDADIKSVRNELLVEIKATKDHLSSRIDNLFTILMGHGERIAKLEERNPPR